MKNRKGLKKFMNAVDNYIETIAMQLEPDAIAEYRTKLNKLQRGASTKMLAAWNNGMDDDTIRFVMKGWYNSK